MKDIAGARRGLRTTLLSSCGLESCGYWLAPLASHQGDLIGTRQPNNYDAMMIAIKPNHCVDSTTGGRQG